MKTWRSLVVFLGVVAAVALLGALSKPDAWYVALHKPRFNPPPWLFAPVWTVLYAAMGIAAWRVYVRRGLDRSIALWALQLACNGAWSPLFFGSHSIAAALADIVVLLAATTATAVAFFRRDRTAGWLMTPYVAWVAFATVLNASIWYLNPR